MKFTVTHEGELPIILQPSGKQLGTRKFTVEVSVDGDRGRFALDVPSLETTEFGGLWLAPCSWHTSLAADLQDLVQFTPEMAYCAETGNITVDGRRETVMELIDYDGVHRLSNVIVKILRQRGIVVGAEYD